MDNIFLSGSLAFFITFFAIPVIIKVAKDKKLFDEPDLRKVHKIVIPNLGGLGIFAGFMIATLLCYPQTVNNDLQYDIAAFLVIFFLGLKDDILILSPTKKFLGQIFAAFILIQLGGIRLANFDGFLGINEISAFTGSVISLFIIIVVTNSFNLIDGVDGLAGSIGVLTSACFGSYFFMAGEQSLAVIAFALCFSLIGFLLFNFPPAKIFMGDTGSLLVGIINAILFIKFINVSTSTNSAVSIASSSAIGFAILIIPVFDTLRVFSLRIIKRRSPFSPDRNHIHHILLDLGLSHKQTTITCVITNILFIGLALLLKDLGATKLILILFILESGFTALVYYFRSKRKAASFEVVPKKKINGTSHKIFRLASEVVELD